MGRKQKYSKEIKVKACEDYIAGNASFNSLSKNIGCSNERVRQWYLKYLIHGADAFNPSRKNRSYTKEFKDTVVAKYISGKYSIPDLCAKHNISDSMISNWIKKYYNGIENKDYYPKGEIYTMKSKKTTLEERLEIVEWIIANDMNYKEAASKNCIRYGLVYQWVQKYMAEGPEALIHKKRGPKHKDTVDGSTLSEVEKLRLELAKEKALRERAELRAEILKKKEEFEKKLHSRK